jgi:hypothetical protein
MDADIPLDLGEGRSGLAAVVTRAALDRHFRIELLADPHRAVRESFGVELPRGLRLKFVEKEAGVDLMVVLPDLVESVDQLDCEELDAVLGGGTALHWPAGTTADAR